MPPCIANVFHANSACGALTGQGVPGDPLVSSPIVSPTVPNILACSANGLIVPGALTDFDSVFTAAVAGPVDPGVPTIAVSSLATSITNPSVTESLLVFAYVSQRLSAFSHGGVQGESSGSIQIDGGAPIAQTQIVNYIVGTISGDAANGLHWSLEDSQFSAVDVLAPGGTVNVTADFEFSWSGTWDLSQFFFETDTLVLLAVPFQ